MFDTQPSQATMNLTLVSLWKKSDVHCCTKFKLRIHELTEMERNVNIEKVSLAMSLTKGGKYMWESRETSESGNLHATMERRMKNCATFFYYYVMYVFIIQHVPRANLSQYKWATQYNIKLCICVRNLIEKKSYMLCCIHFCLESIK